jgi:N-acetylglucosamine kinase-like BadF-type ATPase
MILIADSGSSKTDWAIIEDQKITRITGQGMNPYFMSEADLHAILQNDLSGFNQCTFNAIHFFGAGCTPGVMSLKIKTVVESYFQCSNIQVESDIVGAAKALIQNQEGLILILGTGMNSGWFNGQKIVNQVPSLGYLLGDEASGANIGKSLLTAYLRNELPTNLHVIMQQFLKTESVPEIITQLYQHPYPNRWLASIAALFKDCNNHPYLSTLVRQSFDLLCQRVLSKYDPKNAAVNATGSIAYYYQTELKAALEMHGRSLGVVIQKPIEGLINYYAH